jgi:Ca-activated chloride channel family protein
MRLRFLLALSFILILLLVGCQLTPLQPTLVPTLPPSSTRQATPGGPPAGTLRVAVAPEALAVLQPITNDFNRQGLGTVTLLSMTPADMETALGAGQPSFDAAVPDSSFWLPRLDNAWAQQTEQESLTGLVRRFMLSPVVIATWEDIAASLGDQQSWSDFLRRVESDPNFRWSHPSAKTGPGFLALLGEAYYAAGKSWGLTAADLDRQATRDALSRLEKSVAQYGESEEATLTTLADKGPAYLSAFVATERGVVRFNTTAKSARKLRAVYPREGSAWADYPLTLLDGTWVTPQTRALYVAYGDYLAAPAAQRAILAAGYRTVNQQVPLTDPASPIKLANGVDPRQPQVALQIPDEATVDRLLTMWGQVKRHSRQVWVVDTSGSMGDSQKLVRVKQALTVLIDQLNDEDEVALVRFANSSQTLVPLAVASTAQRDALRRAVNGLQAAGQTALLDATLEGYRLLADKPRDKINGLIVLTDGEENASKTRMDTLIAAIQQGNKQNPIVVFCIAYGGEAGTRTLQSIAGAAEALGQVRGSDPASIQRLYEDLQKYF